MRYLLDANAVVALLNDTTSPIAARRHKPVFINDVWSWW